MKETDLFNEVYDKYSEYLEMMTVDEGANFMIGVLIKMVNKEREMNQFYKQRIQNITK